MKGNPSSLASIVKSGTEESDCRAENRTPLYADLHMENRRRCSTGALANYFRVHFIVFGRFEHNHKMY